MSLVNKKYIRTLEQLVRAQSAEKIAVAKYEEALRKEQHWRNLYEQERKDRNRAKGRAEALANQVSSYEAVKIELDKANERAVLLVKDLDGWKRRALAAEDLLSKRDQEQLKQGEQSE